jgi:hypothetical protein
VVVLPVDPALARNRRRGEQTAEHVGHGRGRSERGQRQLLRFLQPAGFGERPAVERRFIRQRRVRNLGHHRAVVFHAQQAVVGHLPDRHGVQVPLLEDRLHFRLAPFLGHEQHPLLRFRQHDLVGRHAGLALRHEGDVDLHAGAAARAHLAGGARQTGRAHVLDAHECVGLHHLEARLEEQLLHERIADLHRGPLLGRLLVELRRGHRGAMDAIAPGLRSDVEHGVPHARGDPLDDLVGLRDAEAEHVHQRVAGVAFVEGDLAADGGDADAVAVAADAGHDAGHVAAHQRIVERAEAQRVEQRDGPGAHGEDVADDAAHAGGRALIRLDERRVVVRFDLEDGGEAVADVHRAGVFARPLQHAGAGGRQGLQVHARALVAAVLGPHHREDAELGEGRCAAEHRDDLVELLAGDAVALEDRVG